MTETTRRGPYAKGVAKRAEILQEALAAYAASGSDGPSLRAVAARVGLSERGLLHYFASRDELFVAILHERDQVDRRTVDAGTTLDDLAAVQARSSATPGLVRLFLEMAAAAPDPASPAHGYFTERYVQLRARLGSLVARSVRRHDRAVASDEDAAFAARMLIAASDGLQIQWLLDPSIDLKGDLQRLGALLEGTAAARPVIARGRLDGTDGIR